MKIATLKESGLESRVAITPNTAKQFLKLGFEVLIETQAGHAAQFNDETYKELTASTDLQIIANSKKLLQQTNILLCVNQPKIEHLLELKNNSIIIGPIDTEPESELIKYCLEHQFSVFSMNKIPRISRAQNMDSLSSQANLAGYRAVLEAVQHFDRVVPMMMTAAGMIQPAKVLVLGAGVAGLQAIATAKRLGAVVYAFDVRSAAKEQVESLGAEFIEVSQNQETETKGGYASETSDEYKKLQSELIDHYARLSDIVIATALIPDRKAPILLYKKTVEGMKPGSVIVDLATSRGGNCELSVNDKIIKHQEVTLIGISNMAARVSKTASELYANNLLNLIHLLANQSQEIQWNEQDEIIQQALLCHEGRYLPFQSMQEKQHA